VRVVLVILDGMPARHVNDNITPTLARIGREGASTVGRAVMTSATYPNHATFITGAVPAGHGLFANWVHDGERPRPAHKIGPTGPTLFDACRAAGKSSAAVLGDHHLIGVMGARQADDHWPPDGKLADDVARDRLAYAADAEVVARLPADLPNLLVAHLNEPDTAGHLDGPDSAEAAASYRQTDAALRRLTDHLQPHWDDLALIVLSDHDQRQVDHSAPAIEPQPPDGLTVIPEGTAAVVWGEDRNDGKWLDDVDGVAGHEAVAAGVRMVWATPDRLFALPGGLHAALQGHHGGAETRDQVVAIGGGHPRAAELADAVRGTTPNAQDWAPIVADLLGISLLR
jgi:arylsulfatase A-like enzyme